jgi:hypothetical protein
MRQASHILTSPQTPRQHHAYDTLADTPRPGAIVQGSCDHPRTVDFSYRVLHKRWEGGR